MKRIVSLLLVMSIVLSTTLTFAASPTRQRNVVRRPAAHEAAPLVKHKTMIELDDQFNTPDGIILIDYKTGFMAEKDISDERYSKYRRQIDLYALALKKITSHDVYRKFICLLAADKCIEI